MPKRSTSLPVLLILLSVVLLPLYACSAQPAPSNSLKPRIVVLTDISPNDVEPDDMESIIRLFVHADLFEIEALVATTGWSSSGDHAEWVRLIHEAIDGYEEDLPNLRKINGQQNFKDDESQQRIGYWPSPGYLRARTVVGSQVRGMEYIGEGNSSPGSERIIELAGEQDRRPLWVLVWGGGNTLAQAIWQVKQQRSKAGLKGFLQKLRVYTITDQDRSYKSGTPYDISSHQWMRREFKKDLFFIWDECAWRFQNGTGKDNWNEYATHIQGHGTLGGMYPKYKYGVEGDTPSFLYVLPNGLNNPAHPGWGSWGGYFEWGLGPDNETYAYTNHSDMDAHQVCREQLQHFYPATFSSFAARMDWAAEGAGNRTPSAAVNGKKKSGNLILSPKPGTELTLSGSASSDPDGNKLTYSWRVIQDAGTYEGEVELSASDAEQITIQIPADASGKTIHIVLEVTDNGTHPLTGYQRVIVKPGGTNEYIDSHTPRPAGLPLPHS